MLIAAPTRSLPNSSLAAFGCSVALVMSLTVISPRSSESPLTTSTRSSRCRCISALASSRLAPSRTVISFSRGVMISATGTSSRSSKRRSRLVTMPTTRLPSTTGRPEIRFVLCSAIASRTGMSGVMVIGSRSTPASKRLTLATSAACFCGLRFLWTMPMPPSWASVIASGASVTVSIAAETSGRFSAMLRVRRVESWVSRGRTAE